MNNFSFKPSEPPFFPNTAWATLGGFLTMFVMACLLVFNHPYFSNELVIEVDSSASGTSQLFYALPRAGYTEGASKSLPLTKGANTLTFSLPIFSPIVRWDPLNGPGRFEVKRISVRTAWNTIPLPLESVSASYDIDQLRPVGNGFFIQTPEKARDPQVSLTLPYFSMLSARLVPALSLALLIAFGYLGMNKANGFAERAAAWLKGEIAGNRQAIAAFPKLLLFAFFCNFLTLSIFGVSVDDEFAAFRTQPEVWISQGRWAVYLFEQFVMPQPTMPFIPNALFCLFLTIAYLFIVRAHDEALNWKTYLLFPLFCAFPFWSYIAEFYANLPSAGLGLMLVSIAAYAYARTIASVGITAKRELPKVLLTGLAVQASLLATAIAAYQSLLFCFACLGVGIIVRSAFRTGRFKVEVAAQNLAILFAALVTGFLSYSMIQQALLLAFHLQISYIDGFLRPGELLSAPLRVIAITVKQVIDVYLGASSIYGITLGAFGFIVFLGFSALWMKGKLSADLASRALMLGLVTGLMLLPFTMNLLSGGSMPLRTYLAVPYVMWLLALLALSHPMVLLRGAAVLACLLGTFQVFYLSGLYGASHEITQNHDRMLANSIYQRIAEVNPHFDRSVTMPVDFFGAKQMGTTLYPDVVSTTINQSIFSWDGGNPYRIISYMALFGYGNLSPVSPEKRCQLASYYKSMPLWPNAGSVRIVDGITLVKLGDGPSQFHGTLEH